VNIKPTCDSARQLLAQLLGRIAPDVDLASADPAAPMQLELDLDSMDFLNLLAALHAETGLDVPERDYPQLSTIDGFVGYVAAALAAQRPVA
jgi:acyl carrier protein